MISRIQPGREDLQAELGTEQSLAQGSRRCRPRSGEQSLADLGDRPVGADVGLNAVLGRLEQVSGAQALRLEEVQDRAVGDLGLLADVPVMAAYLCLIALVFVIINLIVDLLYFVVDPRLRISRAGGQ